MDNEGVQLEQKKVFHDDPPCTSGMKKHREELLHCSTPLPTDMISLVQKYLDRYTKITAGDKYSLILLKNGQVLATGRNANGQLGIGNDDEQTTPVLMKLGKNTEGEEQKATAIAAGWFHSLILLENGQVLATGNNSSGQLGIGNHDEQTTPVFMNLGENEKGKERKASAVSAGGYHSLILLENGQVLAIGNNASGQLGISNHDEQTTPVLMNLGRNEEGEQQKATAIAAGGYHSLILLENGQVLATGTNGGGQLGIGNCGSQPTPVPMNLGENKEGEEQKATAIAAGWSYSLILLENGQVLATGHNSSGQLGIGNHDNKTIPVLMNLGKNKEGEQQKATAMAAGGYHSLILLESGQVLATGRKDMGQLGIGNDDDTPILMNLGENKEGEEPKATAIAAGGYHSLILLESGQVLATGDNASGQLGIGNHDEQTTPAPMNLGKKEKAMAIAAAEFQSRMISESGQVLTISDNDDGRLGIGKHDESTSILMKPRKRKRD